MCTIGSANSFTCTTGFKWHPSVLQTDFNFVELVLSFCTVLKKKIVMKKLMSAKGLVASNDGL